MESSHTKDAAFTVLMGTLGLAWTPTNKGSTTITVRAYDGTGTVQNSSAEQPFPNGASGLHSIQVTAT